MDRILRRNWRIMVGHRELGVMLWVHDNGERGGASDWLVDVGRARHGGGQDRCLREGTRLSPCPSLDAERRPVGRLQQSEEAVWSFPLAAKTCVRIDAR